MDESRSALVTGAASGIGLALSTLLSERGHLMRLFDLDGDALAVAATQLDAEIAVTGNVADPAAMQALADRVGAVDLLSLHADAHEHIAGVERRGGAVYIERQSLAR